MNNNLFIMPLRFRVWDREEKCFIKGLSDFRLYLDTCLRYDTTGRLYFAKNSRFVITQDTGIEDKNGKNIYTGDIVKTTSRVKDKGYQFLPGIIEYLQGSAIISNLPFSHASVSHCEPLRDYYGPLCLEVIGNIWQNPELLEGLL